jgi:hypothetical protein
MIIKAWGLDLEFIRLTRGLLISLCLLALSYMEHGIEVLPDKWVVKVS